MLLRLIEDGKPENFQQQIYDLLVIIARIDIRFPEMLLRRHATFRCSKTWTFQGDFRTRKTYLNINRLQGWFVTIVTKITFFVTTFVTKNGVENFVNPNGDTYFRVKGKRMAHLRSPEICREKVIFQSRKTAFFILVQIAIQGFTLPRISDFVETCLVWLIYLIHEPNRTIDESFSFNPKNYLARITDSTMLQISDESGLKLILICA